MRKLGYRPMLELFTKTRPFTSPTSTRVSRPWTIAFATLGRRAALQVRADRAEAHDEPRRARADRGQHVARIVHAEVHAGEGDEEHHRDSREHGGDAQPEALDVGDDVHAEESVEEG